MTGLFTDDRALFRAAVHVSVAGDVQLREGTQAGSEPAMAIAFDASLEHVFSTEELHKLVEQGLQLLSSSELVQPQVELALSGELVLHLKVTPQPFAFEPRGDTGHLYVGLPHALIQTLPRVVLLIADALLQYQLTEEGLSQPDLTNDKADYVEQASTRMARKIARLCCVAHELSLQQELTEHDFIDEIRSMGFGESMDVFLDNI